MFAIKVALTIMVFIMAIAVLTSGETKEIEVDEPKRNSRTRTGMSFPQVISFLGCLGFVLFMLSQM